MSSSEAKGKALYARLRASREALVEKYLAGGTIRYDEAIGLIPVGGNPALSTAPTSLGLPVVANTGRREKRVPDMKEDGSVGTTNGRVVLDLDAIKAANIADGIASGTMMDALKKRAAGKVVLLFPNDAALRYGTILLGEVPCMLQLQGDITGAIRNGIFPAFSAVGGVNTGTIHALPGFVENEVLTHRGLAKPANYRGDVEYLNNPVSIWSTQDGSRQSIMLFGVNSEIRMWGEDQVIDLNGFRIGAHERPNRVAAFSSIIDLSNGHFAGLTTRSAKNAHIFSSQRGGRLARNNHFAIRGHGVDGLLIEDVISGDKDTLNHGSYFGTCILNDSKNIVLKNVKQEMLNKAVANSSMALSWYAQLTNSEAFRGYFVRSADWAAQANFYPWMKWDAIAAGAPDTFGNGRTSQFPVLKTAAELQTALPASVPAADRPAVAARLREALLAAQLAHRKSMKNADDTYIQVNTGHGIIGKTFPMVNNIMTAENQIPRSVNLIAQMSRNAEGVRYPDSVAYGFRIGSASEGVGKLAADRGGSVRDVYLFDCEFSGGHISQMEALAVGIPGKGLTKTFNGNALRVLGYTNAITPEASIAPALTLMSKAEMEAVSPRMLFEELPVDHVDTAALAAAHTGGAITAAQANGLYKGSDVVEAGLAAIEAIGLLRKYFPASAPVLNGADNSAVDIGILALRRSMLEKLSLLTGNMIGLKGGYNGDIFIKAGDALPLGNVADAYDHGEIYPWSVSKDLMTDIDKDTEITVQQSDNPATPAQIKADRTLSHGYFASTIANVDDAVFALRLADDGTKLRLVRAISGDAVTYQECADLLGFSATNLGAPADMTAEVVYDVLRNVDGQNHVHKGVFGVRVDQATNVAIKGLRVTDHETADSLPPTGAFGSEAQQEAYGINAPEAPRSGVLDVLALSLNGVEDCSVEDVLFSTSHAGGSAYGVRVSGRSRDVEIKQVEIREVEANPGGKFAQPFGDQVVIGVQVVEHSEAKVEDVKAEELLAARPDLSKALELNQ